jgi:hypothetical protein
VRDASVSFCFVITVDDAMCAKASSSAEVRNNTFSDNVVFSSCGGNKAGMQVCKAAAIEAPCLHSPAAVSGFDPDSASMT